MKIAATCALLATLLLGAVASAKGTLPEDLLKGKVIISDHSLPMKWSSAGAYASQMKGLSKGTIWYDKKSKKVTLYYAAFFARPIDDVQVTFVLYDITNGAHTRRSETDNFLQRGDRVLFNQVTLEQEDLEGNKKYMLSIEDRGRVVATGTFILREEQQKYSGKVSFTDDEAKGKSE